MDQQLEKSLKLIRKYLEETPKEIIEKDLAYFDKINIEGPTIDEYIKSLYDLTKAKKEKIK